MADIDERIAALEEKLKQEKMKKARIQARQRTAAAKKKRSEDTRRKILAGSAVLLKVERGEWPGDKFIRMMDEVLTRDHDRALFSLPEKKQNKDR